MANLRDTQEAILNAYFAGFLDDEEFVLLYDANKTNMIRIFSIVTTRNFVWTTSTTMSARPTSGKIVL